MATLILRNLDDALGDKLRVRAARNGRSVSAELREIVRESLSGRDRRREFKRLAADLRMLTAGKKQTPSERLLRESRNAR